MRPNPPNRLQRTSQVAESVANLLALVGNVSFSHDHAFRQALFSAVGTFLLLAVLFVGYQVYFILQTFIKPLAWAALTGTVLFPVKFYLTEGAKDWLRTVKRDQRSLFVHLAFAPFKAVDRALDVSGAVLLDFLLVHYTKIAGMILVLAGYNIIHLVFLTHLAIVQQACEMIAQALSLFRSNMIWILITSYVFAVNFLWSPEHRRTFQLFAWPLWIWLGLHLASLLGSLAAPVILLVIIVLSMGFVTEMKVVRGKIEKKQSPLDMNNGESVADGVTNHPNSHESSFWMVMSSSIHHLVTDSADYHSAEEDSEDFTPIPQASKIFSVDDSQQGTRYLIYLFWTVVAVEIFTHYYLIPVAFLPVVYRVIRIWGLKNGIWEYFGNQASIVKRHSVAWISSRKDVVAPVALRGLFRLAKRGDRKMISVFEDYLDEAVALFLICALFLALMVSSVITMFLVHQETVHLVGLTTDLMNETIVRHPELVKWLPEGSEIQQTVQAAVDSLYIYGRNWIAGVVREAIADPNPTKAAEIERDILAIADRIYQSYAPLNASAVVKSAAKANAMDWSSTFSGGWMGERNNWNFRMWFSGNESWSRMMDAMDWSNITSYVRNNIETFYTLLDSIWAICKGNVALIFSLVTTVLSIVIMYFSALLHFIICGFVYLAALYYLLSSSKNRFCLLEAMAIVSPRIAEAGQLAEIIEQTISDVFAVSLKMALFYGGYIWVLLSVFGICFKFIPSTIASILAVCPLVPPYLASLPAFCELWFVKGDRLLALLLGFCAWLPSMFVDIAIYGDVSNAHPYMFGLSVAGGLIAMGLEGAVFGPVMMCILVVCFKVYRRIISRSTRAQNILVNRVPVDVSSDGTATLETPNAERRVTFSESVELDQSSKLGDESEPMGHDGFDLSGLSSSKRRDRLSSFGKKQSTPREGAPQLRPDFINSPIQ